MLGRAIIEMGGGRKEVGDQIDHSVGLEIHCKVGQTIGVGEILATVHSRDEIAPEVMKSIRNAFALDNEAVASPSLIVETIDASSC